METDMGSDHTHTHCAYYGSLNVTPCSKQRLKILKRWSEPLMWRSNVHQNSECQTVWSSNANLIENYTKLKLEENNYNEIMKKLKKLKNELN